VELRPNKRGIWLAGGACPYLYTGVHQTTLRKLIRFLRRTSSFVHRFWRA